MATLRQNAPARYRLWQPVIVDGVPGQVIAVTLNVHGERVYGVRIEVPESELLPGTEAEGEAA